MPFVLIYTCNPRCMSCLTRACVRGTIEDAVSEWYKTIQNVQQKFSSMVNVWTRGEISWKTRQNKICRGRLVICTDLQTVAAADCDFSQSSATSVQKQTTECSNPAPAPPLLPDWVCLVSYPRTEKLLQNPKSAIVILQHVELMWSVLELHLLCITGTKLMMMFLHTRPKHKTVIWIDSRVCNYSHCLEFYFFNSWVSTGSCVV